MNPTVDQFTGCLLGLATGDALGAPHEGGPLERFLWRFMSRTADGCRRWTDDTQMTLDLGESLLENEGIHPDALARRFAASYRWSRGYGPGAAKILKRIRRGQPWQKATTAVYAGGSYGNGAAMRAPVLALFFTRNHADLVKAAHDSAQVTHAHPLGITGATLIALATRALLEQQPTSRILDSIQPHCELPPFADRLKTIRGWLESESLPNPREVARTLGNGITAPTSCPTALYIALRHRESAFETMMAFIIACRGDVDTIGAMAGALWGCANGAEHLPRIRLEAQTTLTDMAQRLYRRNQPVPAVEPGPV